ncbi:hypothetical protein [Flagellimonas onchidii]|uniref:hypothetical protein n=1 Tax=Flagellimonas onchidii TaxID=2562684 RepID=UPI0014561BA3|nr:hypothetical protein [Allomuricauda onchidii]
MSALSAIIHDPDMKAYFERKVEEGKNKMLVVNNVRNKLVHRVCAVVKRQEPYVKKSRLIFLSFSLGFIIEIPQFPLRSLRDIPSAWQKQVVPFRFLISRH